MKDTCSSGTAVDPTESSMPFRQLNVTLRLGFNATF